jgi:hypothetical protein
MHTHRRHHAAPRAPLLPRARTASAATCRRRTRCRPPRLALCRSSPRARPQASATRRASPHSRPCRCAARGAGCGVWLVVGLAALALGGGCCRRANGSPPVPGLTRSPQLLPRMHAPHNVRTPHNVHAPCACAHATTGPKRGAQGRRRHGVWQPLEEGQPRPGAARRSGERRRGRRRAAAARDAQRARVCQVAVSAGGRGGWVRCACAAYAYACVCVCWSALLWVCST